MRKLDNTSYEGLRLRLKTDSHQDLKNLEVRGPTFSAVYEAKGVKFCTQVPEHVGINL